jgi:type II secretory pathway pseudopilin PulG
VKVGSERMAFTLTDLSIAVAILSVLASVVVSQLVAAKARSRTALCLANLAKVNRAVLEFTSENQQRLPGSLPDERKDLWWWYKEQVKRYAGLSGASSASDTAFACPDDRGYTDPIPFHLNPRFDFSSYVYNGVTMPGMPNIAGLPLSAVQQPTRTLLAMEWTAHAPLSWHKSKTGRNNMPFYCDAQSVVGFVDGHVRLSKIYYDGYNAAYTQDPIPSYDYQYSGN